MKKTLSKISVVLPLVFLLGCSSYQQWIDDYEYQQKQAQAQQAQINKILLTTGGLPTNQPYTILGQVEYSTVGSVNIGSILNDSMFRSPLAVALAGPTSKQSMQGVHNQLKTKAYWRWGHQVDAIINVTTSADPSSGDAWGQGLVVKFVE